MKIKKLSKGMTLVEVLVAMTIFALMASCIMSMIGTAAKQSAHSKKRDLEVAQQANAAGKKSDIELTQVGSNDYQVIFSPVSGGTDLIASGISYFNSDSAQFSQDFGFNIKSFFSGSLTNLATPDPVDADKYKITFVNNSTENVTTYVSLASGSIYEGTGTTGYTHTSNGYVRTAQSGSTKNVIDFGYENVSFDSEDLILNFVTESGTSVGTYKLSSTSFGSDNKIVLSYDGTGAVS